MESARRLTVYKRWQRSATTYYQLCAGVHGLCDIHSSVMAVLPLLYEEWGSLFMLFCIRGGVCSSFSGSKKLSFGGSISAYFSEYWLFRRIIITRSFFMSIETNKRSTIYVLQNLFLLLSYFSISLDFKFSTFHYFMEFSQLEFSFLLILSTFLVYQLNIVSKVSPFVFFIFLPHVCSLAEHSKSRRGNVIRCFCDEKTKEPPVVRHSDMHIRVVVFFVSLWNVYGDFFNNGDHRIRDAL